MNIKSVLPLLLLPVLDLKGLGQLVKLEEFLMNDSIGLALAHENIPPFFLQEGEINSTAEVAQTVACGGNENLEDIFRGNLGLLLHLEVALDIHLWEIFQTLLDVTRPITIQKAQEIFSFLFLVHQGFQLCDLFILFFL